MGEKIGPRPDKFDIVNGNPLDNPEWGMGAPPIEPSVTEVPTDDVEAFDQIAIEARVSNVEQDYRRFPEARKIAEVREGVEGAQKGWGGKFSRRGK